MDIFALAQRLRDPDPRVRVETLRVLAMVEETRALGVVRWVFQNDPEPGVREVARWAGNLIWQAHQRGHSTERAVEEVFKRSASPERQAMFLSALEADISKINSPSARKYAVEQAYRRRLMEAMRQGDEVPDELTGLDESLLALPALIRPEPARPEPGADQDQSGDLDDLDLLDAGLTYLLE